MSHCTRRSLLLSGTAVLTGLAGCGGDGGTASTTTRPGTPTQPTTLAVEHPVLCAEQPTGYRQYTEQPDGVYRPTDVVWVYFEPSTTGTEAAGEGELRFEYDLAVTVTDPAGEDIGTVEDTASKTIPAGSDLSTVFLTASFSPPTEFETGTHTMTVAVTDAIAGTAASTSLEFDVESGLEHAAGEFGFGRFAFLENQARGYRDYDENREAAYGPTDDVWYYYEIDGFAYEETASGLVHDMQLTETLTGPEGDVWSEADIQLPNGFEPDTDLDTYWVSDVVSPQDEWLPGEYDLAFELTDRHAGETVTETYTYTVVE